MIFFIEAREKGEDWLLYNAPLAMHCYVSVYTDPVDLLGSATYAMLAAETLSVGSCMIGIPVLFSGRLQSI